MGEKKEPWFAVVIGVAVSIQLAFSGWHVLGGLALSGKHAVNAFVFALYREAWASLLMVGVLVSVEGTEEALKPLREGNRSTALLVLGAGIFSFGNVVGTVVALTMISSDIYATYQPTIPVFTTLIAVAFGYETLTRWISLGVATSVTGAILVEVFAAAGSGAGGWLGNCITIAQCISMASLIVVTKPLLKRYTPLTVTAWYYSVGSLFTLASCVAAQLPLSAFYWSALEPWGALAYAAVVATLYAYEAYSWLIQFASPTLVAAFSTLQPVFTVLLNYAFLGRGLGAETAAAGIVVVLGLFITVYGKYTRERSAADTLEDHDHTYAPLHGGDEHLQPQDRPSAPSPAAMSESA